MLLPTTICLTAAAVIINFWLGMRIGKLRYGLGVSVGDGGHEPLMRRMRAQANFLENTPLTLLQFAAAGSLLGTLFASAVGAGNTRWLAWAAAGFAALQILLVASSFLRLIASDTIELRGTARLLSTRFRSHVLIRGALLVAGGMALPLVGGGVVMAVTAIVLGTAGELLARYLFFVTVVPKHMTTPYLALGSEAA